MAAVIYQLVWQKFNGGTTIRAAWSHPVPPLLRGVTLIESCHLGPHCAAFLCDDLLSSLYVTQWLVMTTNSHFSLWGQASFLLWKKYYKITK